MTLEQLRNGFEKLFKKKFILKELMNMEEFEELSEEEVIEQALSDIVTEDMLDYINENLDYVPLVNLRIHGKEKTLFDNIFQDSVEKIENHVGEPYVMLPDVPLLSNKKAFCMGSDWENSSFGYGLDAAVHISIASRCIFIDEDGTVFWATEYFAGINEIPPIIRSNKNLPDYEYEVTIYKKLENDNFCYIGNLDDFIPEEYEWLFLEV